MEIKGLYSLNKITAIIPSLNPDENLLEVVSGVKKAGFSCVILVDDGSDLENRHYFDKALEICPNAVLLRHAVNLGKGRALKTAFNYFLEHQRSDIGAITIDGDNQHHIDDVIACSKRLCEEPNSLILGCRCFNEDGVPIKSSFGNKITAFFLKLLCGIKASDTQTGLRGIPTAFINKLMSVSGERFDFETNMLLEAKQRSIEINEVKIRTIYFEGNKKTHFNPLRDSLLIYKLIFKFFGSGVLSTLADFLLFILLDIIFSDIAPHYRLLIATVGARLFSSVFNYIINKNIVFSDKNKSPATLLKYYCLSIVQTAASYTGVYLIVSLLHFPDVVAKVIVDIVLFFISFQIQREFVFKNNAK